MASIHLKIHDATMTQYEAFPATEEESACYAWKKIELGNLEITIFKPVEEEVDH